MTFKNRLKFFFGVLFTLAIIFGLVLYLNNAISVVHSSQAALNADTTTIGTDYPGLIVKQHVEEGDKVTKGEALFEIQSQQLSDALASSQVRASSLSFSLNPVNKDIILKANDDGVIQKINYRLGSYVPLGSIIATANTAQALFVEAHYHLAPPDYARIKKGRSLEVTFPDNSRQQASVYNISLVRNGDTVDTVIKARLQHANIGDFQFSVGTPVQTQLKLTDKTWYQSLTEVVRKLFKPSAE